jgi:hypothetical protein
VGEKEIPMRITSFLIGLALAFAFTLAPSQATAQEAPKVINVVTYDVAGEMPKFLELYKRAMMVLKKYGSTGESRLWVTTYAGPNTGTVAVAIEYPSMVSMSESSAKVSPSPEWQKLIADFEATDMRILSNSVSVDITP